MVKDGARAFILSPDKMLLFHRDNIPTIPAPDCWSLVGGAIEDGESPEETLVREMEEEVGYVPENKKFLGQFIGMRGEKAYLYLIRVSKGEKELFKHNPEEGQGIGWFTKEEVLQLKLSPGLKEWLGRKLFSW